MENQPTPKSQYSFIRTYKQRATEILTSGRSSDTIPDLAVLIDKEDEYVCESFPHFNIKKGYPCTDLFLAVYDWVLKNYKCSDTIMDYVFDSFSYILLDPNNYILDLHNLLQYNSVAEELADTEFMRKWITANSEKNPFIGFVFHFENITFAVQLNNNNDIQYKDFSFTNIVDMFPMNVVNRNLVGSKKPPSKMSHAYRMDYSLNICSTLIYNSPASDENTLPPPEAPNFFEFVTSPDFCDASYIFPRQLQWGINLFEDYCPYCSEVEFAREGMFYESLDEIKRKITFYEFGKCPKCQKTRADATKDGYFNGTNELNACVGMRGGKTVFLSFAAAYQLHKYLLMSRIDYFGNNLNEEYPELIITFIGNSIPIIYDSLWREFVNVYEKAPWFEKYLQYSKTKYPTYISPILNDDFEYPYLCFHAEGIKVTCETPNLKAIRGRTRIFTAIEDISWLDSEIEQSGARVKVAMNAKETYESLRKTLQSIRSASVKKRAEGFYNAPTAIMCNTSSPAVNSYVNDPILSLITKDNPKALNYHYSTWEASPLITKELCKKESYNEEAFLRDYRAFKNTEASGIADLWVLLETNKLLEKLNNLVKSNRFGNPYKKQLTDILNLAQTGLGKIKQRELDDLYCDYEQLKKFEIKYNDEYITYQLCRVKITYDKNSKKSAVHIIADKSKEEASVIVINIPNNYALGLAAHYNLKIYS